MFTIIIIIHGVFRGARLSQFVAAILNKRRKSLPERGKGAFMLQPPNQHRCVVQRINTLLVCVCACVLWCRYPGIVPVSS